jgi:hypothetical protein
MAESAKMMLDIWAITPNEVREYLGYETFEDESFDEPWVPSGRVPLSQTGESEADTIMAELEQQRLQSEINANNSGNRTNGKGKVP